ncbi:MAG TPA: hypothetical protein VNP73_02545, partial [Actinomycetota bacterium]|nr:hypothetical protein [Actinomycetota bacterium]
MRIHSTRTVAIVACAALLLGAFVAAPAEAKKKKKKKKAPVAAVCAPYAPGEKGGDQPVTVVTDASTAEAPAEVTISTAPGLGFSSEQGEGNPDEGATSHTYANVQVDSANPSAGLFVSIEFTPVFDYDLWLRDSNGTALAYSAGSSPPTPLTDGTGNGGHSDVGSENIDGYLTADCAGF